MALGGKTASGSLVLNRFWAPVLAGVLYFILSVFTISLMSQNPGVSAIWPANALVLAMILMRPRDRWMSIILAGSVGAAAANCAMHGLSLSGILFGAANLFEVAIAAWAISFASLHDGLAGNGRAMMRFVLWGGLVAPGIAALVGATVFHFTFGKNLPESALTWFLADALGLMTFTPFFYALFKGEYGRWMRDRPVKQRLEACLLLLLTSGVSAFVFMAHRPLLFFITMPTMLIAFRIGWIWVKVACIIVTIIGCVTTTAGIGPLAGMTPDPVPRIVYLQIFLMGQLMIQWPVAAMLGARDRYMQQLAKSERSLRFLASQSSVLMLTFDIGGICRKAVGADGLLPHPGVDTMPGLTMEELAGASAPLLRDTHHRAMETPDGFHSAEFPVYDAHERRWMEATFRALDDEDGFCPGTVMTLHDISVRQEQALALTRTAQTDSLTGLFNRAGFLKRLEREIANAAPGTLNLAMIDVDRFKLVNDNCGHQTGDAVLAEIARRITAHLGAAGFVGRMGGDEFVVLLNTPDWHKAQDICARLVHAVRAEPVRLSTERTICAAISCGLARHAPGSTVEQFLNEADMALYAAKRGGRDRMVAA